MMWLALRHAISYVHKMLERGTGTDRQLKVFEETQDLKAVTRYIQSQFFYV